MKVFLTMVGLIILIIQIPKKACKEIAEFFKKNWDENIKVTSQETPNDWEISFILNGEEYVFACQTYFGDDMSYDA